MTEIQKLYKNWWDKNKHRAIEDLREKYGDRQVSTLEDSPILKDSPYCWL